MMLKHLYLIRRNKRTVRLKKIGTEKCQGICSYRRTPKCFSLDNKVQPTVTFPIGDHVNILHNYKKMRPSKILKLLTCRCHHLIDMLVEFSKNHIFLSLLKCLNVPYPSMFTIFCINYYAQTPCGEKIAKNPSTY